MQASILILIAKILGHTVTFLAQLHDKIVAII